MEKRCNSIPDKDGERGGKTDQLFTFGLGGVVACCGAIELLGGAAALGGVAAVLGVSTGLTYLTIVGLAGLLSALLAFVYQKRTRRA